MRKVGLFILLVFFCVLASEGKKKQDIPAPYAWSITQPLGLRYDVPMDTLMHNFYSTDIPSSYSTAYGTTGNLGGRGNSTTRTYPSPNSLTSPAVRNRQLKTT